MPHSGFTHWLTPPGTSLSAFFSPGQSRCGIYILEFADGDRYVGQSIDVVRRFADHSRHFQDIVAVQFLAVPREALDDRERATVQENATRGHRLRNKLLVSTSASASPLDAEIDRPMQESWVDDGVQASPDGDMRTLQALRRVRMRERYAALRSHPHGDAVMADLVNYVGSSVIWPSQTVEAWWSVSVLPSTGRTREQQRLLTVNCGIVETFVMMEGRASHGARWFLNVDATLIDESLIPADLVGAYEVTDGYRSAGLVGRFWGGEAGSLEYWFDAVPGLRKASRSLALGLMRKQPVMFVRSHCDDVVDDVLVELAG